MLHEQNFSDWLFRFHSLAVLDHRVERLNPHTSGPASPARGLWEQRFTMKKIFGQADSCNGWGHEIESSRFMSYPNPAIRLVPGGAPASGEVERRLPIAAFGDTLVSADNDRYSLENRLRRARAELERRIHAGEDCLAEEYFAADP